MRLLYVIGGPVFGGAHNQAARLGPLLEAKGWESMVVLPDEEGDAVERLRVEGIEVMVTPLDRLRMTADLRSQARFVSRFRYQVRGLRRLVRELDADLVQLTGLTLPQPAIAGRREGAAVVWQLLDTRPPRLLRRMLMPVVTRLADTVMSTGVEVARQYPGALELGDRLVPFVPPVDPDEFRPDQQRRQIARSALGVRDRSVVVGTVGNRNPQKGHEYLIRAVSSLRRDYPEVVLRVLGSVSPVHPAYEAGLQRELKEAGLDRRSIGSIEQGMSVADVLPGFDVFVLTSVPRSEGLPTAILEAMACGVPIVATRVGGVSEIVEEGKTGYLVPPRDPPALADAVSRLLRDDELRADLGRRARKLVQERWGIDRCLHAHVQAYETALAVQARRGALATARAP